MYYPLSQINPNLYTNGDEFVYLDPNKNNQPYTGNYFATSNGKFFTGKTPQDVPNNELVRITETPTNESIVDIIGDYPFNINPSSIGYSPTKALSQVSKESPRISIPFPTQADYATGEFLRYFLKRRTNYTYLEVDQQTYENIKNQNPNSQYQLYEGKSITWILTGRLLEVYKINYNITELVEKRDGWLGFPRFFKNNFTKYFSFEASSPVFLYTKGSELKLESTDEDYVGYYNITSIGRIIAGKSATRTTQEYLIPYKGDEKINQSRSVSTLDNEVGTSRRQNIPFTPRY
jgi:hypothetical protein